MTLGLEYGVIGNRLTAALISKEGSIDWCCFPRFDSPSIFAGILDKEKGGSFGIEPTGEYDTRQRYLEGTNVLSTMYYTDNGKFEVLDYLPVRIGVHRDFQGLQRIHRLIRVQEGNPQVRIRFDPKFDYAREDPDVHIQEGIVVAEGSKERVFLTSDLSLEGILEGGEHILEGECYLSLSYGEREEASLRGVKRSLEETKSLWRIIVENTTLPARYREAVVRSLLVLELMRYRKFGATIAAVTTSLPEIIGGERNWDYRYCWFRDSAMTVESLTNLCHFEEAKRFMIWLFNCSESLHTMRDVECEEVPTEQVLQHLRGYKGSTPVRIGNQAKDQRQNDVYGEVLESIHKFFVEYGYAEEMTDDQWAVMEKWITAAERTWKKKDHGIWEFRGAKDHFTFSKMMCWVALDRGAKIAQDAGRKEKAEEWRGTAREIRKDIMEKGWNEEVGAFTQRYGSQTLDASLLLISHVGFLPPDHPKVLSTLDKIDQELREDCLVFRYKTEDDFGRPENAFTPCSLWFVEAQYMAGRKEKARKLFEELLEYSNHLGLFSEDIDPETKEQTGNFPQAYTHMALINAAMMLNESERESPECELKLV